MVNVNLLRIFRFSISKITSKFYVYKGNCEKQNVFTNFRAL